MIAERFDISTLNWVKGEIDETLKQARLALVSYIEEPHDPAQLQFCITYLHQVRGSLELVELYGPAQLAAEMERLAQALEKDEVPDRMAASESLMRAILQLPDYLESLQGGEVDTPLVLLPLLNDLRRMRGQTALTEAAFFQPDLSVMPPALSEHPPKGDLGPLIRKLRRYYQAALLNIVRERVVPQSVGVMATALEKIGAAATRPEVRQWVWVCSGFVEALRDGGLALDVTHKQLLGRIDRMLKEFIRHGQAELPADELSHMVRTLLFHMVRCDSDGERVEALRSAFHLDMLPPDTGSPNGTFESLSGFNAELKRTVSADILEELARAKEVLDVFARREDHPVANLAPVKDSLNHVANTLVLLQQPSLRQVLTEQVGIIEKLLGDARQPDQPTLMRMAEAVLAVENTLGEWGAAEPVERADEDGNANGDKAHDEDVVRQVMKEAKSELVFVRDAVNGFLEEGSGKSRLEDIPARLHRVVGSLAFLSYRRVARILRACSIYIQNQLIAATELPSSDDLDAFADALTSVEYYLEAFVGGSVHPSAVLDVAEQSLARIGYAVDELPEEMPREVDADAGELAPLEPPETLLATDSATVPTLPAGTESPKSDAVHAEQGILGVDEEIVDIFMEEAAEELERIGELFPRWRANQDDREAVQELRRAFHTLKGSGRLIGATAIGEFAWAFESLLNGVIDGTLAPGQALMELLAQAGEALQQLLTHFGGGTPPQTDIASLQDAAFALAESDVPAPHGDDEQHAAETNVPEQAGTVGDIDARSEGPDERPTQAAMDPVLLEIFSNETDGHLASLDAFVEGCRAKGGRCRISDELIRALHTLHGSSRAAQVPAMATVSEALEEYVKVLRRRGRLLQPAEVEILADGAAALRVLVLHLHTPSSEQPVIDELLERIRECLAEVDGEDEEASEYSSDSDVESGNEASAGVAAETTKAFEGKAATGAKSDTQPRAGSAVAATEQASLQEVDADLVEVFLEEAGELLDEAEETLHAWADDPTDPAPVEPLQRMLHTLKGSARMAGGAAVADLSHAVESTLEHVSESRIQPSARMVQLLQEARDRLAEMVDQTVRGESPAPATELIERVEAVAVEQAPPQEVADQKTAGKPDPAAAQVMAEAGLAPDVKLRTLFLEEGRSLLESTEELIQSWVRNPEDQTVLDAIQRKVHTLKGSARAADIVPMSDLSHSLETMLSEVVDGHIPVSEGVFSVLQRSQERLVDMLDRLCRQELPFHADELVAEIEALSAGQAAAAPKLPEVHREEAAEAEEKSEDERRHAPRIQHELVRVRADLLDRLVNFAGEVSIYRSRVEQQIGGFRFNIDELDQTVDRLRGQLRLLDIETEAQIQSRYEEAATRGYEDFDPLEFDRFTQMQQLSRSMLESLNDLTSVESMLQNVARETETLLLQQSRVSTDLQESLMHTRMVRLVENAPRLRRIVRQTASELGKQADLRFEGAETEMDRNMVERILAPIEHLLRNAVAHGIEVPEVRRNADKPETGRIVIAMAREGAEMVITVRDDGAGIDLDAVRAKAIDRGLLKAAADLGPREVMSFILEPGFSTASTLTQVAGRGVGMDVVNSQVKQLGGVFEIDSTPGAGATFTIRLPLTLSLSRALLVYVGEEIYAVPLLSIQGMVRATRDELERCYSDQVYPAYNWLGNEYRLLHLGSVLGRSEFALPDEGETRPLLLAQSGDQRVALLVEGLLGSREIVVKSLGPQLSTLQGLSGATILGDGSVTLILELPSLIRQGLAAGQVRGESERLMHVPEKGTPTVMVVDDSITVRRVTARLLERNNMRPIAAKDGVEALALLDETVPDVILLDIEMPRMDGYELAKHIRGSERLKGIPIIMITSRTGEKHRTRALELGVDAYLGKPFQEADLLENIHALLERESAPA